MSRSGSILDRAVAVARDDADASEAITAAVLEAARDLFCREGVQRTTVEDVARSAGYSRITVYRRFATKDALVDQVVRWEFRRYLEQFRADVAGAPTVEERVVRGFVSSLRWMRGNSLVGSLLAAEPGSAMAALAGAEGGTLAVVRAFVAGQVQREQAAGNVDASLDADLVAEVMVRLSASFLGTPSQVVDLDDDADLARVARQFLVPMLKA